MSKRSLVYYIALILTITLVLVSVGEQREARNRLLVSAFCVMRGGLRAVESGAMRHDEAVEGKKI